MSGTCCNFFDLSGRCTNLHCPANSTIDVHFQCACNPGFTTHNGTDCVEINECDSSPCKNGGTCTDQVAAFSCSCLDDFSGSTCEECKRPFCKTCSLSSDSNDTVCSECVSGYGLNSTTCRKTLQYFNTHNIFLSTT